jgi:hypothetical protein
MIEVNGGLAKPNKTKLLIIAAALVFLVLAGTAGFFAWQFFSLKNDPNKANKETVSRLTSEIGSIYMLPSGTPTVAQIEDKTKLSGQSFFDKAENGDYIVVYTDAKLALVYRESNKKLVNVGPITLNDQATPAGTTDASKK